MLKLLCCAYVCCFTSVFGVIVVMMLFVVIVFIDCMVFNDVMYVMFLRVYRVCDVYVYVVCMFLYAFMLSYVVVLVCV